MRSYVPAALGATALGLAGFLWYPGHTWLQSDTLIYVPIFEHLSNPALLARDLVATRPHVTYTIYDEVTLALRNLTGLDLRWVLYLQQILFRILGIWGVWKIAASCGLRQRMAALVAACFSLGAVIGGPTVLIFEYEPVPRGFAVTLLLFAAGLAAAEKPLACGLAGVLATLYHPPTSLPFWAVYVLWMAWRFRGRTPLTAAAAIRAVLPPVLSVALLVVAAHIQTGEREPLRFFWRIDPIIEQAERVRASYNWIDTWAPGVFWNYLLLAAAGSVAWLRIRKSLNAGAAWFAWGLPAIGLLSLPLTYLLLNVLKWGIMPALQPARACLFVVVFAVVGCAIAGVAAADKGRWREAFLWFLPALAPALNFPVQQMFLEAWSNPSEAGRLLLLALLAALATLASRFGNRAGLLPAGLLAAALAAPFLSIPAWGQATDYPGPPPPALYQLSRWAENNTGRNAVFLFPGFGRSLEPAMFRAIARRAVYVDWKGGGQINYLREFALEWWDRWQQADVMHWHPDDPERYRRLGIDYLVAPPGQPMKDEPAVYRNARFVVYSLAPGAEGAAGRPGRTPPPVPGR